MIAGKRVLAVICARGGSKGVVRKNVRMVAGKPLLAYSIEAARKSRYLDAVVVSSDDKEILEHAANSGATLLERPPELALDETPGIDPVLHALTVHAGFDYVVLLQPTSPLRLAEDIDGALELCLLMGAPACVAVCEAESSPWRVFQMDENRRLTRFLSKEVPNRRQDLPPLHVINGAVYVAQTGWLETTRSFVSPETVGYLMPMERSLDIDTELDLKFFEFLLTQSTPPLA